MNSQQGREFARMLARQARVNWGGGGAGRGSGGPGGAGGPGLGRALGGVGGIILLGGAALTINAALFNGRFLPRTGWQ